MKNITEDYITKSELSLQIADALKKHSEERRAEIRGKLDKAIYWIDWAIVGSVFTSLIIITIYLLKFLRITFELSEARFTNKTLWVFIIGGCMHYFIIKVLYLFLIEGITTQMEVHKEIHNQKAKQGLKLQEK